MYREKPIVMPRTASWRITFSALLAAAVLAAAVPGVAQDLEAGLQAARRGDWNTALREIEPLAEQGDARAMNIFASVLLRVPDNKSLDQPTVWYRKAAEQGSAAGQANLGYMYLRGYAREGDRKVKDYGEALKWFREAAEQGFDEGQFYFGVMHELGIGTVQDYNQAAIWYRRAAEQGNVKASTSLGTLYSEGKGVAQDYSEAMKWFYLAANAEDHEAKYQLGLIYENGLGVPKDPDLADLFFRSLHAISDDDKKFDGFIFGDRWYIPLEKNKIGQRSVRYLADSDADKQYMIAEFFRFSEIMPQDLHVAAQLYRLAAEQGHLDAMFDLGEMYFHGSGVPQDFAEAARWWRLATEQGHTQAQFNLTQFYKDGTNEPKDTVDAELLYQLANQSGIPGPLNFVRDCPSCPLMIIIPAGDFMMGSPEGAAESYADEKPAHRVVVRQPFAISKYEVTFLEWDDCVAFGGCNGYRPDDEGFGRGDRPVINISHEDAQAYVDWLSGYTGQIYRLPSEAEWEYAARAGTETLYHFGDTIDPSQANFGLNEDGTQRVGSYPPNAFGLHDMHGNVWEIVADCWNDDYQGAPADTTARTDGDCNRRAMRGGSWLPLPRGVYSANRDRSAVTFRSEHIGFRIVRTLP
jgi:formylglycine-generating enzyme required for sulfatase activity